MTRSTGRPGERPLSVVREDRRRGPGNSLEPRRPGPVEPAPRADAAAPGEADVLRARLRERTADLQRLRSEFDHYRARVRRDRRAVGEIAVANVLAGLLPVLDAIDEARAQGEVTGGFGRVAEVLEKELGALGLRSFGAPGDPFDPAVHEAVSCTRSDRVERPVCAAILRPGYRVGDQLLRPAQAHVAEPGPPPPGEAQTLA
ncbi:nucleotide exchange factor GrpE [Streptomyces sp. NPDC052687]|uniref:nucleotide exchange factor GrpE n=1 Tax=Streptomyces sp. NPDC052687 TaxID=3154759 RepID=UPI0034159C29